MNKTLFLLIILITIVAVGCQSEATPTPAAPKSGEETSGSSAEADEESSEVDEPIEETVEEPVEEPAEEPVEEPVPDDGELSFDLYGGTDKNQFETTESGLQYNIYQDGDGQLPTDGQMVMVNFQGFLNDGTVFADSAGAGGPVPLPVGSTTGLIGLDEALTYLSAGSSSRIVIPAELLVDENGGPSGLPAGDVAIEMEVVEIIDGPPESPQAIDEGEYTVTDSGLMIHDLQEGAGEGVEAGQIVAVHYTGWLEDDTVFDSSIGREPFSLLVGSGQVIPGWDEGLQGMKIGGQRQLVIPAELGYGPQGSGPIPPDSVLIFEVEVIEISEGPSGVPQAVAEEDYIVTDSGLKYYDFEQGSGPEIVPLTDVSVDYTGWLEDGTSFDSSIGRQPLSFVVGNGSVIQGWDEGLLGMKLGGRRQLVIPADLAYGEGGSGSIPPNSVLIFEVEIVEIR